MKIFLSWSGSQSQRLAEALRNWLPLVIQAVRPYFSPDDIQKGTRWNAEISKELEQCFIGIICLTRSNLNAPWLIFEAGALAKSVDRSRVIPLLFGVEPTDLQGPLLSFQAATFKKSETLKILRTMNSALAAAALEPKVLDSSFEKWWPELDAEVRDILQDSPSDTSFERRSDRELLEELLLLARQNYFEIHSSRHDPVLASSVENLELNNRIIKSLKLCRITSIRDLAQRTETELLQAPGIDNDAVNQIKEVLASRGLTLGIILDAARLQQSSDLVGSHVRKDA